MEGQERLESLEGLESIASLGKVSDTKEVIKGYTIKLETLSVGEQQAVFKELHDDQNSFDRFHCMQRLVLSYATREINGKKIDDSNRDIARKFYFNMQDKVLTEFYKFYLELIAKQNKIIEELKKK